MEEKYLFIVRINSELGTHCRWCGRYLEKKHFYFITRVLYKNYYVTLCPICEDIYVSNIDVRQRVMTFIESRKTW